MKIGRSVKVELLRHGKPHNQLLSPLTQYLGLSGSHEAGTVHIPYEHNDFMNLLKSLRYEIDDTTARASNLKQISAKMSDILNNIPGLGSDLSVHENDHQTVTHMRLTFTASELAMLPFEMSDSPGGFPGDGTPLSLPLVVTVASCDSGKNGSVLWPGSSLAHTLHEYGVPLVVASQFPLSKRGSIYMTEVLYGGFLWGKDPRLCLHELRQKLRGQDESIHDWASLVAYASLPENLNEQLASLKTRQAKKAMEAALSPAHPWTKNNSSLSEEPIDSEKAEKFEKALSVLEDAVRWTPAADRKADNKVLRIRDESAEILAMLGFAKKRQAQALFQQVRSSNEKEKNEGYANRSHVALEASLEFYRRAFNMNPNSHWAGVQFLSLNMAIGFRLTERLERDEWVWNQVRQAAEWDLNCTSKYMKAYAHGSLAELHFLAIQENKEEKAAYENVDKTKLLKFNVFESENKTSFDFLGFTFYMGRTITGRPVPKLKSSGKKIRTKLTNVNLWCKENRSKYPLHELWNMFCRKLRGHIQYYGVSFNFRAVRNFVKGH